MNDCSSATGNPSMTSSSSSCLLNLSLSDSDDNIVNDAARRLLNSRAAALVIGAGSSSGLLGPPNSSAVTLPFDYGDDEYGDGGGGEIIEINYAARFAVYTTLSVASLLFNAVSLAAMSQVRFLLQLIVYFHLYYTFFGGRVSFVYLSRLNK